MQAVTATAGPSPTDLLQLAAAIATANPLALLLAKTVLWFHTPADERARRRATVPATSSPDAAGTARRDDR